MAALLMVATMVGAPSASASSTLETVAYEGFDYSGSLANGAAISARNGGTGWAGAWTSGCSMTFNTTGLTYSGLATVGGRAQWGTACLNNDLSRTLPRYDSGVIYVQFLSQLNLRGGGTPQLRLVDGGANTGIIGNNDGGAEMALLLPSNSFAKVNPGDPTSSGVSITSLNLTIVRIDHDNDRTQMWVNPNLATFDYLNPTSPQVTVNNFSPAFEQITLLVRDDTTDYFDEISIKRMLQSSGDPAQRPPDSMQQVGRLEGQPCPVDWNPSWAQWPNNGTGGFVCVQVLTWSHSQQAFVIARGRGMTGSPP